MKDNDVDILKFIYFQILNENMTLSEAAKGLKICRSKLKSLFFQHLHRTLPPKNKGRPIQLVPKNIKNDILEFHSKFPAGYKRTFASIAKKHPCISEYKVRIVFEEFGLFQYEKEYLEKNDNFLRYVAKYANQIWHTDLHFSKKKFSKKKGESTILIGFLDDRTRKILHCTPINDKSTISTTNELVKVLEKFFHPNKLVTDNGKEFVSELFSQKLEENGIKHWKTIPYHPQQNGKMERFWKTLESSLSSLDLLDDWIIEYNQNWPHSAIKELTGEKMTPQQAWNSMIHWDINKKDEIEYYK